MLTREEVARRIRQLPLQQQAEAASLALRVYGPAPKQDEPIGGGDLDFSAYRFDVAGYIQDKLGWEPWSGTDESPGQLQIVDAYELALRQQLERRAFERGEIEEHELRYWRPGQQIRNWLRCEAGHTVGKTKLASGLFSHFFDCFPPAIVYTFAPGWKQIKKLLWKEIETDRRGREDLRGRVLDNCEIKYRPDHFASGAATNNAGGNGTERLHGQHGPFLMFILDEAEGIPDFVYDAIGSMTSGGVVIVLMFANPRTRRSRFHKCRSLSQVRSFRMSCTAHPNVVEGREVIPGAVRRDYVEQMIEAHAEVVREHEPDNHTFELPFPVRAGATVHPPGTIFRPDNELMFRVLGIAPANSADNTFVPVGRYEAAKARPVPAELGTMARMGVDVARYGNDMGSIFTRHGMLVRRDAQLAQVDTNAYAGAIKVAAERLATAGVKSLHVRIDAGGGFGGGVADRIKDDAELHAMFDDFRVLEVEFGATAHRPEAYADVVTELYHEAAESLKGLTLDHPPAALEQDLTEREFKWVNLSGVAVRRLEAKEAFRKRLHRSPDDGDAFVLAAAPDFLFPDSSAPLVSPIGIGKTSHFRGN